jgi:hypothetical protein
MKRHLFATFLGGLLLAACATTPLLPEYPDAPEQIRRFYREHAWERGATCVLPRMDTISDIKVVRDTPEQLVVEVRYWWIDDTRQGGDYGANLCAGVDTRTFTFDRTDGLRITGMSGEHRPGPGLGS